MYWGDEKQARDIDQALATLEDENDKKVSKKWKKIKGGLAQFCGVKSIKK